MANISFDSIVKDLQHELYETKKLRREVHTLTRSIRKNHEFMQLLQETTQQFNESIARSERLIELLTSDEDGAGNPLSGSTSSNEYVKALLRQIFTLSKSEQSEINFCWEQRTHFDNRGFLPNNP